MLGDTDPIGQIIRIKTAPFTIVGELGAKGMSMTGSDQDDIVLVPYTSAMVRLSGGTTFRSFNVQGVSAKLLPDIQSQIIDLLRQRHRITDGREDDFIVRTQEEISDMATQTSRTMTVLLGAIAGVSLLVGGIGIMNIMLVSVTERTREIGLRMAIGARGRDVLLQFLVEAVVLSLFGGMIGIALGFALSRGVTLWMSWPTAISPQAVVVAFGFAAVTGIFFGFYPARKAAALDPIDALRFE